MDLKQIGCLYCLRLFFYAVVVMTFYYDQGRVFPSCRSWQAIKGQIWRTSAKPPKIFFAPLRNPLKFSSHQCETAKFSSHQCETPNIFFVPLTHGEPD